ncbi:MAG: type I-E CRISPR-associated protein Cas7/Cse4/CasC [bacterium]|nr:type I-E CRISPR-associated protein Cas7/Cse4/CasC [bacterium]
MCRFIQLHVLTSYPACNLNRDDMGRPKTVRFPGGERLRVSSQSLKRSWRCSEEFQEALAGNLGVRTKELGKYVYYALNNGVEFDAVLNDQNASGTLEKLSSLRAMEIARAVGGVFGKMKAEYKKPPKGENAEQEGENSAEERKKFLESLECEQLAHLGPAELKSVGALVEQCRESGKVPEGDDLNLLRRDSMAVDVALFGRMLASSKEYNVEAAAQVAHAITVHNAIVEDDFFTAVDDLNKEDTGAGHMGVAEFGAGLFYIYLCIDRELLTENLGGNAELAGRAISALTRAVCTVSPTGKQSSFASRAKASFCLAEKGDAQPRTLAEAFMPALKGGENGDVLAEAIRKLEAKRESFNRIMGEDPKIRKFSHEDGTLEEVCTFVAE